MVDFTQTVMWDSVQDLTENLLYGIGRPALFNIGSISEGLVVDSGACYGQAKYVYDFGRLGTVTSLDFTGSPEIKFRIKIADTVVDLDFVEFEGTDIDTFSGTVIDTTKYNVDSQDYTLTQSNALYIAGAQGNATDIFENPGRLTSQFTMSDTYGVSTTMKLTVDTDEIEHSGSFSFLELDNGTNNVQIQKYYAQIRSNIVDTTGHSLGRDVESNDIILGESIDIEVDNIVVDSTTELTDGLFGTIEDEIQNITVVDEFNNLKNIEEAVDFIGRKRLSEDCVRILGIRADYSTTGVLADLERGLYYKPKRINGYYALQVPVIGVSADTFANRILSLDFNASTGQYEYAEVNDIWTTTISVSAGVHYYYFLVDGERVLDSNNSNRATIASGEVSVLTSESTNFVDFTYNGQAESVQIVGTFNNFVGQEMSVGFDPSEVLKINLDGEVYHNNHNDWHKIEITFDVPIPIVGVRFVTDVPYDHQQRVRILLNDAPITKDEWRITCSPATANDAGTSQCATYSNLLNANTEGDCLSSFINYTDVRTASEDEVIEWEFIQDEPINDREIKTYTKFAFMTRLDNNIIHSRAHRSLEILLPSSAVAKVTDFLVSDNEVSFRNTRRTTVCPSGEWSIIQTVLQNGDNSIAPTEMLADAQTYGVGINIEKQPTLSFIETLNQSEVALNNTEVACTLATNLTHDLETVIEVTDLGVDPDPYGPSVDQRFTRESFTRASDRLKVVVINIDIEPVSVYYLHLVAQPTNFFLEVYETEDDAQSRVNRLGYAESSGYGFEEISIFTPDNPLDTPTGPVYIDAENIIVCFDQNAANTIFETRPRANI